MLRNVRIVLWGLVGLALLGAIYFSMQRHEGGPISDEPQLMGSVGGPFTLTDGKGRPFGTTQLAGKPYAIFFGYTNCPDVCPTTMARLTKLRKQLGQGDNAFAIVFVTVDPERDGPKEVGAYSDLFGSPIVGLTGSPARIEQVKKLFGAFSEKVPEAGGGYSVNHTATVFLMDRDGKFLATVAPDENDAAALAKLKRLTA